MKLLIDIIGHARDHGHVVLTHDLDFGAILSATRDQTPSVVQIRGHDVSPDGIGPNVSMALRQLSVELEDGALVTIDPKRVRLSVLPLRADRRQPQK